MLQSAFAAARQLLGLLVAHVAACFVTPIRVRRDGTFSRLMLEGLYRQRAHCDSQWWFWPLMMGVMAPLMVRAVVRFIWRRRRPHGAGVRNVQGHHIEAPRAAASFAIEHLGVFILSCVATAGCLWAYFEP